MDDFDEMEFKSLFPQPVYKKTPIKQKPPTKLALKRTLRRSSMYDKLIPSVDNSKLNVVDVQSTETSSYSSSVQSSPKPVKPRRGFIIINDSDSSSAVNYDKKGVDNILVNDSRESGNDKQKANNDEDEIIPPSDNEEASRDGMQVLTTDNLKANNLLSKTKLESIQSWVKSVDPQNIIKNKGSTPKVKSALNSTFALDKTCVPFDRWMKEAYSADKRKDKRLKENNPPDQDTPNRLLKKYLGSDAVREILQENSPKANFNNPTQNDKKEISNKKVIHDLKPNKRENKLKTPADKTRPDLPKNPIRKKENSLKQSDKELSTNSNDVLITPAKQMINNNEDVSKLLDNLYGNSWHKNKAHILTDPRQPKTIQINRLRVPQTEKKPSKEPLYRNPYLDSEKERSSNLLKSLQKQRVLASMESPFFARPACVDDDTSSPTSSENKKSVRSKANKQCDDSSSTEVSDLDASLERRLKKKKKYIKPTQLKFDDEKDVNPSIKSSTKKPRRRIIELPNSDSSSDPIKTSTKSSTSSNSSGSSHVKQPTNRTKSSHGKPDDLAEKIGNITIHDSSSDSVFEIESSDSEYDFLRKPKKTPVISQPTPKPRYKPQEKQQHTFLSSLSKNIPDELCDASALIYKKNFKKHRDALTKTLFSLFNEKIFDKCLAEDTPIEWSLRMTHTAGLCRCFKRTHRDGKVTRNVKLQLSTKVLDSADRLRDTLVHEMCHAATYIVNEVSDGHGPLWRAWANRAMRTFPELPRIERCHNYAINYKYTYKCTSCGYSFGRHSKSLDCARKRCGYCHGTFEVLLNKICQGGEQKSVPCTPKKDPSGFALFVKLNYALHKSPSVNHQDLMKLLGKKYAETKDKK